MCIISIMYVCINTHTHTYLGFWEICGYLIWELGRHNCLQMSVKLTLNKKATVLDRLQILGLKIYRLFSLHCLMQSLYSKSLNFPYQEIQCIFCSMDFIVMVAWGRQFLCLICKLYHDYMESLLLCWLKKANIPKRVFPANLGFFICEAIG